MHVMYYYVCMLMLYLLPSLVNKDKDVYKYGEMDSKVYLIV